MKTVMKKMFCLMLVAVMLVGVMPFQASAAAGTPAPMRVGVDGFYHSITATSGQTSLNVLNSFLSADQQDPSKYTVTWLDGYTNTTVAPGAGGMIDVYSVSELPGYPEGWVHTFEAQITLVSATCGVCSSTYYPAEGPHTCPPLTCENCGTVYPRDTTHTVGTDCCSECDTAAHNDANCPVLHPVCEHCNGAHQSTACTAVCPTCKNLGTYTMAHNADAHCDKCGAAPGACAITCTEHPNYETTCTKCQVTYVTANGHVCCDRCKEGHATENCPYCVTCWAKGDKVTTHTTAAHCTTCDTVNGHKTSCTNYSAPVAGSAKLYVWANLYVGEKKVDTVLIDTITGLSADAKIYQVISDNRARIMNNFPAGYSNDSWSNNVYFMVDADTANLVTSRMTVGGEDDAIINLYANQKLVVARVHLSKSYAVDLAVQINGFRVGDTITEKDVKKAVRQYYNVSSMKIYTYGEWEKVVAGKDANNITNFIVQGADNDNVYEVYVSGSRSTSSNSPTYKADSTNPKTGDMIFAPVAVLGLSASALAVLFFLNKKRAF